MVIFHCYVSSPEGKHPHCTVRSSIVIWCTPEPSNLGFETSQEPRSRLSRRAPDAWGGASSPGPGCSSPWWDGARLNLQKWWDTHAETMRMMVGPQWDIGFDTDGFHAESESARDGNPSTISSPCCFGQPRSSFFLGRTCETHKFSA